MFRGHPQPVANRIQLYSQDLSHPPQGHPLDQKFEGHQDPFLWRAEVIEDGSSPTAERVATSPAEKSTGLAFSLSPICAIDDNVSLGFLSI
jgi:hypothetical protein